MKYTINAINERTEEFQWCGGVTVVRLYLQVTGGGGDGGYDGGLGSASQRVLQQSRQLALPVNQNNTHLPGVLLPYVTQRNVAARGMSYVDTYQEIFITVQHKTLKFVSHI